MPSRNVRGGSHIVDWLARLDLLLIVIVTAGAAFSGYYATRGSEWVVMTDELQQVKLAASIADSLSPVPRLHGEHVSALSQLYPLLIAPFVALLRMPAAIDAIHVLNGLLIAVAAWPAYRLTLDVTRSRLAAYLVAALTAFLPWTVLATTLTTPVVAYPVTVWAVLLLHRAIVAPTPGHEAAALGGLALAFLARTQLLMLAPAYPLAVVLHEVGFRHRLRSLREHRVLAGATAAGFVTVVGAALLGRAGSLLGNYSVTASGDLLPAGVWTAAVQHVLNVSVPTAMLPVVLAAGWTALTLYAPPRPESHAYACLLVLLVPLAALQVASFDLRFTPGGYVQGRYLFFVIPLLLVAAAACLGEGRRTVVPVAIAGIVLSAAIGVAHFDAAAIFWASPSSALQPAFARVLPGSLETSMRTLTAVLTVGAIALLLRARPVVSLGAVLGALLMLFVVEGRYLFVHEALPLTKRHFEAPSRRPDWIDAALPRGTSVALVPSAHVVAEMWWDIEYWNERVDHAYSLDGATTYTPFPNDAITLDRATGAIAGLNSRHIVLARGESRFGLRAARLVASTKLFRLLDLPRGARADWTTTGLTADGWTQGPARLRLYPRSTRGPRRRAVTVRLASIGGISRPTEYEVNAGGHSLARGLVRPNSSRAVRISVCVPANSAAEATLTVRPRSRIVDGRIVGLRVEQIETAAQERPCSVGQ